MQTYPLAKHRALNNANDFEIQINNIRVSVSKDFTLTARVLRTQTLALFTMIFRDVALEVSFPSG